MSIASHKLAELRLKLAGVEQELETWRDLSAPAAPLEKHHTQIRRVTFSLQGACDEIREEIEQLAGPAETLARARALASDILAVHRVWEFFRSKFALRVVKWFETPLRASDELAWACYGPARAMYGAGRDAAGEMKEPPLVFLNGGSSPFSIPRHQVFFAERILREDIKKAALLKILQSLPVPVVGVPWFHARHLPGAPSIAHEVGHLVLSDFRLSETAERLLRGRMEESPGVPAGRRGAWLSWLHEIFADLYGTLCLGPAFTEALIGELAEDAGVIAAERPSAGAWRRHPPAYLRVLLNLEALAALGFGGERERLKSYWAGTYASHAMAEFEPDIPAVVASLLEGPYPEFGNAPLTGVISFSPEQLGRAAHDKARVLGGKVPNASPDVRTLYAAACLAFTADPAGYDRRDAHRLLMAKASEFLTLGVRAAAPRHRALDEQDRRRGRSVFHRVLRRYERAAGLPAAPHSTARPK